MEVNGLNVVINNNMANNQSVNASNIDSVNTKKINKSNFQSSPNVEDTVASKAKAEVVQQSSDTRESRYYDDEVTPKDLDKALDVANETLKASGRHLQYSIHEKTHKVLVKVIDSSTDEVIREVPPEKLIDTYAKMLELAGMLFDAES